MCLERYYCFIVVLLALCNDITMGDIPGCKYHDTVEIFESERLANGSYNHKGIIIPKELTGEYDYEELSEEVQKPVSKHIRGCICKLKPCLRLCCNNPKTDIIKDTRECSSNSSEFELNSNVNVTHNNGKSILTNILDTVHFWPLYGLSCERIYTYEPELESDAWRLLQTGDIERIDDKAILSKSEYCLHPLIYSDNQSERSFQIHACETHQPDKFNVAICYVMSVSVVCIVITILVYIFIRKVTNHLKCLISYLITLSLLFSILVSMQYWDFHEANQNVCIFVGYLGYFTFMSAFSWLTVISVSMWRTFRDIKFYVQRSERKRHFVAHCLVVYGIAGLLTLLIYLAEIYISHDDWKPNIKHYCWINIYESFPAYMYFYGPMFVLIVINFIMFISTAIKIYEKKKSVQMDLNASSKFFTSAQQNFSLYLRLFVLMGIVWLSDILSYSLSETKFNVTICKFVDSLNAAHGIIIFILFVDFKLVYRRIVRRETPTSTESSSSKRSTCRQQSMCSNSSMKLFVQKNNV